MEFPSSGLVKQVGGVKTVQGFKDRFHRLVLSHDGVSVSNIASEALG